MTITSQLDHQYIMERLANAMADQIEEGSLHGYPSIELRNEASGEVLFRCDIDIARFWYGLELKLRTEWSYPIKDGFCDKLTILNADGKRLWSATPEDFCLITPECPEIQKAHRKDGWQLSPSQSISVYIVPIRFNAN